MGHGAGAAERLVLGRSAAIRELRSEIRRIAGSSVRSVLVLGESGTGKDLVPRVLHACAGGAGRPLEVFNCPAIPSDHLESELFGTARGAYPGALDRSGAAERAHRGTLMLDEVGAMPLLHQGKILRLLETGEGRRLGSTRGYRVDATFVAATNEELARAISEGRFREDLYYRLVQDAVLLVPPLRERLEDVGLLARAFLAELSAPCGLDAAAEERLCAHAWPGNVRELRAVVRGAAHRATAAQIRVEDVERALERITSSASRRDASPVPPRAAPARGAGASSGGSLHGATHALRRQMLIDALSAAGGNQTLAGVMLGLHERSGRAEFGATLPLDLRARKLAQRKFRYWWDRLVAGRSAGAGDDRNGGSAVAITPTDVGLGRVE